MHATVHGQVRATATQQDKAKQREQETEAAGQGKTKGVRDRRDSPEQFTQALGSVVVLLQLRLVSVFQVSCNTKKQC